MINNTRFPKNFPIIACVMLLIAVKLGIQYVPYAVFLSIFVYNLFIWHESKEFPKLGMLIFVVMTAAYYIATRGWQ